MEGYMTERAKKILDRINRVIETSDHRHKAFAERYISLANRQLHKEKDIWGVMGASQALLAKWEKKFGVFMPRHTHI
jgi:hypothetical protein